MIAAIGTIHKDFGTTTRAFLGSLQSQEELEPVLTALSNEILELPRDFVLVLDDYHTIRSETIHDALSFLMDHSPPPMHLVLAGRTSPPLPLPRLRARGRLTELGVPDLRFTLEEAADFLRRTMGLDLTAERVATLEKETEGWIVGLQLAAHALRGGEVDARSVEPFAGSARHVFDYLADEVLSRQPEDVREFLLKSSIVETLSGPLCEALTDTTGGREMLERLERANLFLVPLDEKGRYYRYHHLFAAFLRERLQRVHPDVILELHRRAGLWYEDDGCISGAVDHALAAEDFDRAAGLIEEETAVRRRYVDASLLVRWLGTLPDQLVRQRPQLCMLYAWALAHAGQLEGAERRLQDIEEALKLDERASTVGLSDEERTMLGEICIIRARMAAMRENAPLTTELSNRALDLLPEGELHLRGDAALDLGHAYCSVGDLESASGAFARAAATGRAADDLRTALFALRYQASLEISRGRLRKAEDLLFDGQRLAESRTEGVPSVAGMILNLDPLTSMILRTNLPTTMGDADYNNDGFVNAADYTVWRNTLGSTSIFDADGSGPSGVPDQLIDMFDYQFWKDHYGETVPGSGAITGNLDVPEPATAWLLVFGAILSFRRARFSGRGVAKSAPWIFEQ